MSRRHRPDYWWYRDSSVSSCDYSFSVFPVSVLESLSFGSPSVHVEGLEETNLYLFHGRRGVQSLEYRH